MTTLNKKIDHLTSLILNEGGEPNHQLAPDLPLSLALETRLERLYPKSSGECNPDFLRKFGFRRGWTPSRQAVARLVNASVVRRAAQVWLAVHTAICVDTGFDHPVDDKDGLRHVIFYACLEGVGLMLPWVKTMSAHIAAAGLQQEETDVDGCSAINVRVDRALPGIPRPQQLVLGFGWVRRYCLWVMAPRDSLRHAFGQKVVRAAENILYIKRGCPPMEPDVVESELELHRSRLTRPPEFEFANPDLELLPPVLRRRGMVRRMILSVTKQIVNRLYRNRTFEPKEAFPSRNASYAWPRRAGGAMGELLGLTSSLEREQPMPISVALSPPTLGAMLEVRPGRVETVTLKPAVEWISEFFTTEITRQSRKWACPSSSLTVGSSVDYLLGIESWFTLYQRGRASVRPGRSWKTIKVKPSPVLEPCKCRVITLGEAVPYQRLFSMQRYLWGALSGLRTFEFTHKPITGAAWQAVFGNEDLSESLEDLSFLSGDFSAATDNLHPELIEGVWKQIASVVALGDGTPLAMTEWFGLVMRGLSSHQLHYRDRLAHQEVVVDQSWGQLMGSPVSFPILNIINAAAAVVACYVGEWDIPAGELSDPSDSEEFEERFEWTMQQHWHTYLEAYHVRTNGDDLFFMCRDGAYSAWKGIVRCCGLLPSLGKNYLSKDFVVMNSQLRVYSPHGDTLPRYDWVYQKFCDAHLLMGLEAKGPLAGQQVVDRITYNDLGPLARTLVAGIEDVAVADRRLYAFLGYYRQVLDRVPAGVDYFFPEWAGGLGIPRPSGFGLVETSKGVQLALARAAWLCCLDERRRAKALSFPPTDPSTFLEEEIERAASYGVRDEVLVTADTSAEFEFGIGRHDTPVVPLGIVIEHLTRSDIDLSSVETAQLAADAFEGSHPWVLSPWLAALRREHIHRRQIRKQLSKVGTAMRHGLNPLRVETLSEWRPNRLLKVRTVHPPYRSVAICFDL